MFSVRPSLTPTPIKHSAVSRQEGGKTKNNLNKLPAQTSGTCGSWCVGAGIMCNSEGPAVNFVQCLLQGDHSRHVTLIFTGQGNMGYKLRHDDYMLIKYKGLI